MNRYGLQYDQFQQLVKLEKFINQADAQIAQTCANASLELNSQCLLLKMEEQVNYNITHAFNQIEISPVVYDLNPKFQNGKNEYPFEQRKNRIEQTLLNLKNEQIK